MLQFNNILWPIDRTLIQVKQQHAIEEERFYLNA